MCVYVTVFCVCVCEKERERDRLIDRSVRGGRKKGGKRQSVLARSIVYLCVCARARLCVCVSE